MVEGDATMGDSSARAERRFGEESAVCCRHMLFPSFFALRPPLLFPLTKAFSLDETVTAVCLAMCGGKQ